MISAQNCAAKNLEVAAGVSPALGGQDEGKPVSPLSKKAAAPPHGGRDIFRHLASACKGGARQSPLWLDEYFDRVLSGEMELTEKLECIHDNPRRRWPELDTYSWVWLACLQDAED